jgi:hypothetical protein
MVHRCDHFRAPGRFNGAVSVEQAEKRFMNRPLLIFFIPAVLVLASSMSHGAVDGTMGTPLGGVGAGGIRFCAHQGAFYAADSSPCSMGDFQPLGGSAFQLYTNRNGTIQTSPRLTAPVSGGRADDDAAYPLHSANLGGLDSVAVTLLAFSPVCFDSVDLMCLPYGFFEISLANTAQTPVDAAIAMRLGATPGSLAVPGKGCIVPGPVERAIYAASAEAGAVVSAGSDGGFIHDGRFSDTLSGDTAAVAVKVTLPPNQARTVRFVYAWRNRVSPDRYFYSNLITSAGEAAQTGLSQFVRLRDNAVRMVTRMRASNFPDWIKDHTLNSLCNLTTNSIYTRDGRHCYTEGQWNTNGTMDQMWHARQIMIQTVPDLVWKELDWWARTQKTDPAGQLHHDMGNPMSKLWGWDETQHPEYAYQPDCNPWVDLNCAFIISAYEAFCATGNKSKLDYFWPYIKKAGSRILEQVGQYGDTAYRYTFVSSLNSYDQPGIDPNPFNAGLSTVAYRILGIFSDLYRDAALKATYQTAFDSSRISFVKKYLSNNFSAGRFSEALLAGQWIGFFCKLGQFYPQACIDSGLAAMDAYYKPLVNGLGFPDGSYNEWAPYLISHYGGLCLQTGRFDRWRALQVDWYERNYLNRDRVFDQELGIPKKVTSPVYLATVPVVYYQYISVPVLWRNYYTMLGFFRNKPTGELWLEPLIPPEMDHSIKNGFYLSPEGSGTISAVESGNGYADQEIIFRPDKPVPVTALYLRDKPSDSVTVFIDGAKKSVTRIGEGYARELKVDYNGTIDSSGIVVKVLFGKLGIRGGTRAIGSNPAIMVYAHASGTLRLPACLSGKPSLVGVFNARGELVARRISKKSVIDVRKDFGISHGFTIIQVAPLH